MTCARHAYSHRLLYLSLRVIHLATRRYVAALPVHVHFADGLLGWNFQSSNEIAPYLEPAGSGISALWARTKALQHNTNVLVGYPEKVDTSGFRQSSPKFYNSAILVNGDGETVANYRKSFLYHLDERWAEEGKGFFGGRIPGLGNTAIGICKF